MSGLGGGFNFGVSSTPKPATTNPLLAGFSFGTGTATTATSANTGTTTSGFSFGSTAAAPSTGLSLGTATAASTASGFSFGTTTPAASTAAPTLGGTFGATPLGTTNTPAAGFSFNSAATAATTAQASGFSFSSSTTTASSTAAAPSFFSTNTSTAPSLFSTGNATSSAASTTAVGLGGPVVGLGGTSGLGGVQTPASNAAKATTNPTDGKSLKDSLLPQEIFATIAAFETFKTEEKTASEANLRQSATSLYKLGDDCTKLRSHVVQLATTLDTLQHKVNSLKDRIVSNGSDIEMVHHTQNTPAHLQGNNTSPEQYFVKIINTFKAQMIAYKERIDEVEKCLAIAGQQHDDGAALMELIHRQHDTLQVVASHVYRLHAKLIQLSTTLPCPEHLAPKPLFGPNIGQTGDHVTKSAVPRDSQVIRTCFDKEDGSSCLGRYQINLDKAKAFNLNPPPTQPLQPSVFGANTTFNSSFSAGKSVTGFGNTSFQTGNDSMTNRPGSLFSSTFGQHNKLFKP